MNCFSMLSVTTLYTAWMKTIKAWPNLNLVTGSSKSLRAVSGDELSIDEVTFAPDTTRILTINGDTDVHIFDADNHLVAQIIDEEIHKTITECYAMAKDILTTNIEQLRKLCEMLIEKEVIEAAELTEHFGPAARDLLESAGEELEETPDTADSSKADNPQTEADPFDVNKELL